MPLSSLFSFPPTPLFSALASRVGWPNLVAAYFKSKYNALTVKKGNELRLTCDAFGEKPMSISWSKDRIPFDPSNEPRYHLVKEDTIEGFSVSLRMVNVDRRDNSLFTCTAANAFGKDEYNIQVIVQGIY